MYSVSFNSRKGRLMIRVKKNGKEVKTRLTEIVAYPYDIENMKDGCPTHLDQVVSSYKDRVETANNVLASDPNFKGLAYIF